MKKIKYFNLLIIFFIFLCLNILYLPSVFGTCVCDTGPCQEEDFHKCWKDYEKCIKNCPSPDCEGKQWWNCEDKCRISCNEKEKDCEKTEPKWMDCTIGDDMDINTDNHNEGWQPPTAEEEALEKPLIDPIDIMSIFGGGLLKSLFGGAEKIATDATEKAVYYYFKDPSGTITKSISEEGIKVSKGFFHTLGYEGKVFVSEIPPDKISKINLFSYGIKDADSFVKVAVEEGDLAIPAQTIYYGEKGARVIKDSSGLYKVGADGVKHLSQSAIKETGTLATHEASIKSITNNLLNAPRCLTRYWLAGGGVALDIHQLNKK